MCTCHAKSSHLHVQLKCVLMSNGAPSVLKANEPFNWLQMKDFRKNIDGIKKLKTFPKKIDDIWKKKLSEHFFFQMSWFVQPKSVPLAKSMECFLLQRSRIFLLFCTSDRKIVSVPVFELNPSIPKIIWMKFKNTHFTCDVSCSHDANQCNQRQPKWSKHFYFAYFLSIINLNWVSMQLPLCFFDVSQNCVL